VGVILIAWAVFGTVLYRSQLGDYLEAKISAPVNFWLRDKLGYSPKQNDKLKIFVIDDMAFAYLGGALPTLDVWADLLDGMAESKPKLIVVDAIFGTRPTESLMTLKYYFSRIEELGVPITVGSFIAKEPVRYRAPLDMASSRYDLSHYFADSQVPVNGRGVESHIPNWAIKDSWSAYGPAPELRPWFNQVGHIQIFSDHKMEPFLRLSESKVLPHITMFAADSVKFTNGNLLINEKRVALDRSGAMDVDFLPPKNWDLKSLKEPLIYVKNKQMVEGISPGDTVLILPQYFTGNTDFRPSPFGLMPGGLFIASMLNSILTDHWLQPILATEVIMLGCLMALAFLLPNASISGLWLGLIIFNVTLFAVAQGVFTYFNLVLPWLIPGAVVTSATIHLIILRARAHEKKVIMLRAALDGAVDQRKLEVLLKRPERIDLEPRERVVTLMFVDVVGFSLSAENMLPRIAFDSLKGILGTISKAVHEHGGIVDKSLGDGVLCYFGYRFDSDLAVADHAAQALRCAIQIQAENMALNDVAVKSARPLYPLRIGINTASCFLGDLGSENRIEFTVVGNGVNFAKRLEGACEMFSIMMGATTRDLIHTVGLDPSAIARKLIRIKHHKELVDAYEYDPIYANKELRSSMIAAFRKSTSLQRLNERILVTNSSALILECEFGTGIVLNFSGTGVSTQLVTPLVRGSRLFIQLDSRDGKLKSYLSDVGIGAIEVEVRWNYHSVHGFVHGMLFLNLSEQQSEAFVSLVSRSAMCLAESPLEGDDLAKPVG
jgi:class 3 adenylate cyclase